MTRQEKYPETMAFHFYNANPKNRFGSDCVIRAICTALQQSWEQTVKELTEISLKTGYVLNDPHCFKRYLKEKGWVMNKQPRKSDGTKFTGYEFCAVLQDCDYAPFMNIVANIGGNHTVAIVNGKVNDTWDSTDGCIGNFWTQDPIELHFDRVDVEDAVYNAEHEFEE